MNILILEDDLLIAELLQTLIGGLYPSVRFQLAERVADGQRLLTLQPPDLVIADWNLPDGSGLEVIKALRAMGSEAPVLVITARSDRQTVMAAARYRINGFITKPFQVQDIRSRLQAIMPSARSIEVPELTTLLEQATEDFLQLPVALPPDELVALLAKAEHISVQELAQRWHDQPQLLARLLDIANSSSFRRSGEACKTPLEAIRLLGVAMSLNLALGLALDVSHSLRHPLLVAAAEAYMGQARSLGDQVRRLAALVGMDSTLSYTAAMLHCIGELAVLSVAQRYVDAGGELDDKALSAALKAWAGPLGNKLKVDWHLPLDLRDLIGAVYLLTEGSVSRARVLMRAAALINQQKQDSDECQRLLRRLGVNPEELQLNEAQG